MGGGNEPPVSGTTPRTAGCPARHLPTRPGIRSPSLPQARVVGHKCLEHSKASLTGQRLHGSKSPRADPSVRPGKALLPDVPASKTHHPHQVTRGRHLRDLRCGSSRRTRSEVRAYRATAARPARSPPRPAGGPPPALAMPQPIPVPDWSWLGTVPKYRPTALASRKRSGSSMAPPPPPYGHRRGCPRGARRASPLADSVCLDTVPPAMNARPPRAGPAQPV